MRTLRLLRLANSNALSSVGTVLGDVWEPATGYHRLRQTLTVNATATNSRPSGTEIPVLNFSAVAETYDTWKARNFPSNPGAGAPDADPDADGRPNLVEYAVGSNPNTAARVLPGQLFDPITNQSHRVIIHHRRRDVRHAAFAEF